MKTLKTVNHERGFVLLVVYMVVMFVCIFSVVFFARHRAAIQATERYQNRILAFNAAEAGIDFALHALSQGDYSGSTFTTLNTDFTKCGYTVRVETTAQYNQRHQASDPSFIAIPENPSIRIIDANGFAPDNTSTSRAYQTSNITVYSTINTVTPPPPPPQTTTIPSLFKYGIYAIDSINLSGQKACAFDSYDSSKAYGGTNISHAGAIAANNTGIGHINLSNTTAKGSALVSAEGDPATVITVGRKATLTGTKGNLPSSWELARPPELPETHTDINLSNVSGQNAIVLAPGNYHCTGGIKITGQGQVTTTGAVKIYVDGAIDIAGNGITIPNNHPGNLHLYETGSADVKFSGNGSFFGGVFAPNSTVTATGNGDIFGAVVAKNFSSTGNGAVHFDLAMKEDQVAEETEEETVVPTSSRTVSITAWQELNSLAWGTGS